MSTRIAADPAMDRARDLAGTLSRISGLQERVLEVARRVDGRTAFSTSLGLEDQAVLHAIASAGANVDLFTLDTGRHFPETLETLAESERRYSVRIRVVAPDAAELEELVAHDGVLGFRLSVDARKACCDVRKVRPLRRALTGAAGWITGVRRGQSTGRADVPFAAWDDVYSLIKINLIADWTSEQLETYVAVNDIPVNPLHARGYPSIGCQPCTRAVHPGEHTRAGRWWWEQEDGKECGLHDRPKTTAATAT